MNRNGWRAWRAMLRVWLALGLALGLELAPSFAVAQSEADFLPPEQAFVLEARMSAPDVLVLHYRVAKNYYLYRERFVLTPQPGQAQWLGQAVYPKGEIKHDPVFDQDMEVYHHDVDIRVPLTPGATQSWALTVTSQGCAEAGLCYPPMDRVVTLAPVAGGYTVVSVKLSDDAPAVPESASGAGLAVSTPPESSTSAGRTSLAAPAANMASTTASSPAFSTSQSVGEAMNAASQPTRPVGLGALLQAGDVGLAQALSGLGWLKTAGVFLLLGMLLALTPCVLPMIPIVSSVVLGLESDGKPHTRWRGLGLAATYVLGMSVVYTVLGVAAGLSGAGLMASLQKPWVLVLFALLLVALALAMFDVYTFQMHGGVQSKLAALANRIPGGRVTGAALMGAVSALIVGPCVAAPLAGALLYISHTGDVLLGAAALFALAWGMGVPLLAVGGSAGALLPRAGAWMNSVKWLFGVLLLATAWWMLTPVLPSWAPKLGFAAGEGQVVFQPVRSVAELDAFLTKSDRPVMLDFYADWCVSCREMERYTFGDAAIAARMHRMLLLRADVTANNANDRALLKRFSLFGPPGTIFFAPGGRELTARVIGFQDADRFGASLDAALAAAAK